MGVLCCAVLVIEQSTVDKFYGSYNPNENTSTQVVYWDPREAARVAKKAIGKEQYGYQSPALGLVHEMGHAAQWLAIKKFPGMSGIELPEKPVVFGVETKWAKFYGEPIRHPSRAHGGVSEEGRPLFWKSR